MMSILLRAGALVSVLMLVSCSNGADCILLGDDDVLKDVDRVALFACTRGVTLTDNEAPFMVGVALGFSQIERSDVRLCLRTASDGRVEYRLLANSGAVVGWRSPTAPPAGSR